jgi:predicted nucleic acid-binding protein
MRNIIDTNVWIDALSGKLSPAAFLKVWGKGLANFLQNLLFPAHLRANRTNSKASKTEVIR